MHGRIARYDASWLQKTVAKINNATENGGIVGVIALGSVFPGGLVVALIADATTWWAMTYLFWLVFPAIFSLVRLTLLPYQNDYDPLPESMRVMPKLKRYGLDQIAAPLLKEMYEHGATGAHKYNCNYCEKRKNTVRKLEATCDGNESSVQYALEFIAARKELSA